MCLTGQVFIPGTWAFLFLAKSATNLNVCHVLSRISKCSYWEVCSLSSLLHWPTIKAEVIFLICCVTYKLQDKCRTVSESVKYFPVGKPRIPPPSLPSQAAEDQSSTAEKDVRPKKKSKNKFPLPSEKSTKQAPRGTNKTMDLPLKSKPKARITSPIEDEAAYDILRRCSQCGILLPLPTLNQHQVPSFCSLLTWL